MMGHNRNWHTYLKTLNSRFSTKKYQHGDLLLHLERKDFLRLVYMYGEPLEKT